MSELHVQQQIDAINAKLDLLLEYMQEQRLKAGAMDDLMADLTIVGKDLYQTTVEELDTHSVALNPDEVKSLVVKLLNNVGNFSHLISLFESVNDLARDAQPIVNEMIIEFTRRLHELDRKGYFEIMREVLSLLDKVVTHLTPEDVRQLADSIPLILDILREVTRPENLEVLKKTVVLLGELRAETTPQYSIWKVMREMNSPAMKNNMGFVMTFLKRLSDTSITNPEN